MIRITDRPGTEQMWRNRLCRDCVFFVHVPFTAGRCGRKGDYCGPSVVDERTEGACGLSGEHFKAKEASAA